MKEMSNLCAFMKYTFKKESDGDLIDTGKIITKNNLWYRQHVHSTNTVTKCWHHCLLRL